MFLTPKCGLSPIAFLLLGLSRAHDDVGVVQVSVNSDRRQAAFDGVKVASNFAFPGQFGFFYKDGHSAESCATECAEFGSTYFQLRKSSGNCGCTRKGVPLGRKTRNNDFDIYEIVEKEQTTTETTTEGGTTTSEAATPACERPSGWCTHGRSTYDDTEDCDGDGVADPQCESMATTGESGYIASSDYCDDKWGRGNNIQNCNKAAALLESQTSVLPTNGTENLIQATGASYTVCVFKINFDKDNADMWWDGGADVYFKTYKKSGGAGCTSKTQHDVGKVSNWNGGDACCTFVMEKRDRPYVQIFDYDKRSGDENLGEISFPKVEDMYGFQCTDKKWDNKRKKNKCLVRRSIEGGMGGWADVMWTAD
jgi:hypothetical protein